MPENEARLVRLMRVGFHPDPLAITENGTYDVRNYKSVEVEVEGGGGGGEIIQVVKSLTFAEYQNLYNNGSIVKDGETITLDTSGNTTYYVEV